MPKKKEKRKEIRAGTSEWENIFPYEPSTDTDLLRYRWGLAQLKYERAEESIMQFSVAKKKLAQYRESAGKKKPFTFNAETIQFVVDDLYRIYVTFREYAKKSRESKNTRSWREAEKCIEEVKRTLRVLKVEKPIQSEGGESNAKKYRPGRNVARNMAIEYWRAGKAKYKTDAARLIHDTMIDDPAKFELDDPVDLLTIEKKWLKGLKPKEYRPDGTN